MATRRGVVPGLAAGAAVMVLAACGGTAETDRVQSAGAASPSAADVAGDWTLTEGSGPGGPLELVSGYPVTLSIEDGQLGGRSACNHYGAELNDTGGAVRIDEIFSTDMGCEEPVMALETSFHEALADVDRITVEDSVLRLTGPSTELVFEELPPVPTADLVGTEWTLSALIDGETASSVGGEPATLLLGLDGTLSGSTGCRELTGRWTESGAEIVVPELSTSDDVCPEDLADQDGQVVTVIGDGFGATVEHGRLTLTSQGGLGLTYDAP